MSMRANVVELAEYHKPEDQKAKILELLGDIELTALSSQCVVATYVRPNKSKGGILFTDKQADEDRFQGKVSLLLKKGATAFKYDGSYPWEGPQPEIGDWVIHRTSDTSEMFLNGVSVRWIEADLVKGIITDPTLIY